MIDDGGVPTSPRLLEQSRQKRFTFPPPRGVPGRVGMRLGLRKMRPHERGIALDPTLVVDTMQIVTEAGMTTRAQMQCGEHTARELIARGLPCTALVAGTDLSALAAMRIFRAAGYRVPDRWFRGLRH